jgi:hypothetical protein
MENVNRILVTILTVVCVTLAAAAQARIPAPPATAEQTAKAEEAKAKAVEAAKKESEHLGKAQDRAADNYKKSKGKTVASAAASTPAKRK